MKSGLWSVSGRCQSHLNARHWQPGRRWGRFKGVVRYFQNTGFMSKMQWCHSVVIGAMAWNFWQESCDFVTLGTREDSGGKLLCVKRRMQFLSSGLRSFLVFWALPKLKRHLYWNIFWLEDPFSPTLFDWRLTTTDWLPYSQPALCKSGVVDSPILIVRVEQAGGKYPPKFFSVYSFRFF